MTANAARMTNGGKPPTLGDRLDQAMVSRNETVESLAGRLGFTAAEVGRWADDRDVPSNQQIGVLATYFDIPEDEVRRLVLRSQMRNVQRDIRRGGRPTSSRT